MRRRACRSPKRCSPRAAPSAAADARASPSICRNSSIACRNCRPGGRSRRAARPAAGPSVFAHTRSCSCRSSGVASPGHRHPAARRVRRALVETEGRGERVALDLAGRALRDVADQEDAARHLEGGVRLCRARIRSTPSRPPSLPLMRRSGLLARRRRRRPRRGWGGGWRRPCPPPRHRDDAARLRRPRTGMIFSPPRLMVSFTRPVRKRKPSASNIPFVAGAVPAVRGERQPRFRCRPRSRRRHWARGRDLPRRPGGRGRPSGSTIATGCWRAPTLPGLRGFGGWVAGDDAVSDEP